MSKNADTKTTKSKAPHRVSKQERAKLTLPVARIEKLVRRHVPNGSHVSSGASVAMTAAVEYMVQELLELAGNVALDKKKCQIKPTMVYDAISADPVLGRLYAGHVIVGGGYRRTAKPRAAPAGTGASKTK